MNKLTILAGTALLATAGAALEQPGIGPRGERGADLTRQQAVERADRLFARLDLDNDGRATAEEARQAAQQRRAERAGRMFERLDANRDGSVSRAEFDQARAQRAEQRAERGRRGPRMGMRGLRHGGPGMRAGRMFGEQGFVTREQMRERALARFDRLDADRDGTVTADERRQAREQMRQRIRERRGRTG